MNDKTFNLAKERINTLPHNGPLAADQMFGVQSTGYIQKQYLGLPRLHLYLGFLTNVHSQQKLSLSRLMSFHSQQQAHLLFATEKGCTRRLKKNTFFTKQKKV